ncbi:MAG TPA: HEPN domain-containing protein [Sedimentisphaerales bacterium]|nr:HEPN domain-containing protein [Sedimentisphaerales bacterium]HNU30092.1 HEPN domain-containing protein [Sedimentisphaerales bacterium]
MAHKVVDNWLALAEYDLATADAMLQAGRLLYVGFMCQQAVEKVLKACYVKYRGTTPPYTHNLFRLIAELPLKDDIDSRMLGMIEVLNSYYIESRYTEDIESLAKTMTESKADQILQSTRGTFAWLKSKL